MGVRAMNALDLACVARLSEQLGYPVSPEKLAQRFERLSGAGEHRLVVVEQDRKVAGWTHVCLVDGLEAERFVEIRALVVDAAARRAGVGRALVAFARRWAQELGVGKVRVRSNVARDEAHRFYPALGFVKVKTQACYEAPAG